jgi:hypothetical protein
MSGQHKTTGSRKDGMDPAEDRELGDGFPIERLVMSIK